MYSSVWLTNQNNALSIFLTYGKDLTEDEMVLRFEIDEAGNPILPHSSPKLSAFKDKV